METPNVQLVNTFRICETTRAGREELVHELITAIEEGEVDPMKVHVNIKNAESIIKSLTENKSYKSHLLEAVQNAGKGYVLNNASFEVKEVNVKYNYSVCGDPVMDDLLKQQAELDRKIKTRESFLKAVPAAGILFTDEQSGETTKIFPPGKSSTTSVAVTLL